MKTQTDIRNSLGDDISWKSLYAKQHKIYATREEAIAAAIDWCSQISITKVIEELRKQR